MCAAFLTAWLFGGCAPAVGAAEVGMGADASVATRPSPAIDEFISGGIPFPQGALRPEQAVMAVSLDGRPLPTQAEPLAFWPDRSVKWLLVTALLPPDLDEIALRVPGPSAASQPSGPSGAAGAGRPAAPRLSVERRDGGYHVDTGPLRFRVGTDTNGFIGDAFLVLPGREPIRLLRESPERLWRLDYYVAEQPARQADRAILPAGSMDESALTIESVELERSGPLHAVFVLRGWYRHERLGRSLEGRGEVPSRVDIRIHAFAGQSYVAIDHTFVYEGNPRTDFLAACGMAIPLNLTAPKARRITAAAGQHRVERWMYANPLFATDPPDRPNPGGVFPFWRSGGLVHDAFDHYRVWKLAEADGSALTMDEGNRCGGWIDLADDDWGCAVGIAQMAEQYPAGLEASNEDATVTAWLYPPQVAPADLRRYTQVFGTGEAEPWPGQATGISKTHRLWAYFHPGRDEAARVADVAASLNGLRLLKVDPQYIARTGVLGPYRWADPERFPRIEQLATGVTDFMLAHQAHFRWFGIFDHGDFQSVYRWRDELNATDNRRWMNDWGRWGWVNDGGLITYWLLWQFLRTGRTEYFQAGSAMAAHVRDIDVKHTRSYPWGPAGGPFEFRDIRGYGHRHNVNHWGDAYIGPRVANPIAWRLHYYLTGDGRTKDCIEEVYRANVVDGRVWDGSDSVPTALYALLAKYEMTAESRYREQIEAFLAACCDYALRHGHFPHRTPWDFQAGRATGEFGGNSAESFFWHSFGMPNFLIEWYALTNDERLRTAMMRQADATLEVDDWSSAYCHFQILAAGYALTRSDVYRERIAQLLQPHVTDAPPVPPDREDWLGPEAYVRPKTISMIGFLMSGLPYVTGAFAGEPVLWPERMAGATTTQSGGQ